VPGRFTLTASPQRLRQAFPWLQVPDELQPRYNIAPTQPVAVVLNDGSNKIDFVNWGLIPAFTSAKMTSLLINARSETVARTPSFRGPFKYKRCIVLADGIFEWVKYPRKREKVPYWVHLRGNRPFALAGVWDRWTSMDGSEIITCATLTCEPNELVVRIHHRMGVILHDADIATWLQPGEADPKQLQALLKPYPAAEMTFYQVSPIVSNARNDVPECVQQVPENPPLDFPH
jgi:putative SOS response-associated peptidase YedK